MISELTFCELRAKEVVNCADGKKLGKITDIVFTVNGGLKGIVAPQSKKLFSFGCQEIFIPFCNIKKIGEDVIIVELPSQFSNKNCIDFDDEHKKKRDCDQPCDTHYSKKSNENRCEDDCDNRCEKCMLFDCKKRWSKSGGAFIDKKCYD